MKRIVALLFLLMAASPAQAILLSGAGGVNGNCLQGSLYADGCSDAPTDGAFRDANYFTTYGITAHRPPWNVPGVDYPVGYQTGNSLTDWQSYSHTGCTVDSAHIRCDGQSGLIFDKIDFSLHGGGYLFLVGDTNTTVTNSKFGGSSYPALSIGPVVLDGTSTSLDFEHNNVDGGCTVAGGSHAQATLLSAGALTGTYTIKYNWFGNYCQQIVEANGSTWTVKYNFIDNGNIESGGHQNYQQWANGTVDVAWDFNTTRQTAFGGAEGPQFYFNSTGTIHSPDVSNNTMVAIQDTGQNTMSYMIHGSAIGTGNTTLTGTAIASQNYIDFAGALGAFYPGSFTAWTAPTANVNMTTGGTITFP